MIYELFDIVIIKTVQNVKFVSGPTNAPTVPQGKWIVVGAVRGELLLAKDNTIITIPPDDIMKFADYKIPFKENDNVKEDKRNAR